MPRKLRVLHHTFVRYGLVGLFNTAIGLGSIYIAMTVLGLGYAPANALGYSIGILASFALNRNWTFASRETRSTIQFVKFVLVLGVAYFCNLLAVALLVPSFSRHPIVAQALGTVPYVMIGYLGSKYFAFTKTSNGHATPATGADQRLDTDNALS